MTRIPRTQTVYSMSAGHSPVARASSGETVIFETQDCFGGQITREEQLLGGIDWGQINPATGPLFVEGAQPGDLLKVTIVDIRTASQGVMTAATGEGAVGCKLSCDRTRIIPVRDGCVHFSDQLVLEAAPMIGVIGTAPAQGQEIPTGTPDRHGGNMDNTRICKGAVLYFPVKEEGALLAMGDLHALMSDGEVLGCGLEIAGEVEAKVEVVKGASLPVPVVVSGGVIMTVASAPTLDEAALNATHNMMDLITGGSSIDPQEAGMLLSLKGDLRICQIVDPMRTARMEFPMTVLERFGFRLP